MTVLRALDAEDWPVWRTLRLAALADAPEAFGSTLAEWLGDGDTEQRWRRRLADVAYNVVAEVDGEPVGMASGDGPDADGSVELLSMWVSRAGRGRGVGAALVGAVVVWARAQGASRMLVEVVEDNVAATTLYRRLGFMPTGVVAPGPRGTPEVQLARELGARDVG